MGMVPATRQIKSNIKTFIQNQPGRLAGCPGPEHGIFIQPLEYRTIRIAKPVHEIRPRLIRAAELLQPLNISSIMACQNQIIINGLTGSDLHTSQIQQTICLHK